MKKIDAVAKHHVVITVQGNGLIDNAASVSISTKLRAMQLVSDGNSRWSIISDR